MAIDRNAALEEYRNRVSGSSDKLVKRYVARNDKLARASSDDAQRLYEEALKDPKVLKRRQSRLRKLSEEDLNRAMREKGASAYAASASVGADKWSKNAAPFLDEIDRIVSALPPKSRNIDENFNRRAIPLAKGLRAKKDSMQ